MSTAETELIEQQSIVTTESEYWRAAIGRIADSSRAIDSALVNRMDEARAYPKHARSLSARALRQRMLLLAAVLVSAAVASVVALPSMIRHAVAHQHKAAPRLPLGPAALARDEAKAASWIRERVSASAVVACDPLMCGVLAAHGVAPARMQRIGSNTGDPLTADVVVATPAIRDQFGSRLAQVYAPGVLAQFGAAPVQVDVRVVVNGGAAGRYLPSCTPTCGRGERRAARCWTIRLSW